MQTNPINPPSNTQYELIAALLMSVLAKTEQNVILGDSESSIRDLKYGVSQGSVL